MERLTSTINSMLEPGGNMGVSQVEVWEVMVFQAGERVGKFCRDGSRRECGSPRSHDTVPANVVHDGSGGRDRWRVWKPVGMKGKWPLLEPAMRRQINFTLGDSRFIKFRGRKIQDEKRSPVEGLGHQNASLGWGSISGISRVCWTCSYQEKDSVI